MALAPLTAPNILVTSKVKYDCTTLGLGQTFSQNVYVVVDVVIDNVVIVVEVAGDCVVVVVVIVVVVDNSIVIVVVVVFEL